jgi:hypothetical protein
MAVGIPKTGPTGKPVEDYRELYSQACESYRAIDDFRMKLLGLLPIATGAGVLALLNSGKVELDKDGPDLAQTQQILAGVAIFGVAITLGLFAYELHGIKKCGRLIKIGARIETDMGTSGGFFGQFATRPQRVARVIDVPFASSVVYPASVAVWVFVGLVSVSGWIAVASSGATMIALFAASVWGCRRLDRKLTAWDRAQELLHAHQLRGGPSAGAPERRPLTADVFLAAMKLAENPGMVRFGPDFRKHRGWAIGSPENPEDQPTAEGGRPVAHYLCPNGKWWSRENGLLKPAEPPAPARIDAMLRQVLSTHELQWPTHEVPPGSHS